MLKLKLKTQQLNQNDNGHSIWENREEAASWPPEKTALLLCDVWDNHWCRGAVERLEEMLPAMNDVVKRSRQAGVHIIHAPSETLEFYAGSPARKRMLDIPPADMPEDMPHEDPPLPVDATDGGSDTGEDPNQMETRVWTRQHPGIEMDEDRDVISDQGIEVYAYMQHHQLDHMLIMGVHTNMCVLHRTFAIKQMVRWSKSVALIRDLTDAMYNPAKSPYVSHGAGTQLIIEFIEKFWCPTILSADLIA